jgi:putative peptide zinc metalloprotease protein
MRAVFLLEPGDRQLIRVGNQAHLRVHGLASRSWLGTVTEIAQVEAGLIPQQLSSKVGGDVATRQDTASRLEKPVDQHYLVAVRFAGADATIQPGVLGRARVEVASQTLWWRLRRYLATTFNWGL